MPVLADSSSASSSSSSSSSAFIEGGKNGRVPCGKYLGGLGLRIVGTGVLICVFVVLFLHRRSRKLRAQKAMASTSKSTGPEKETEYAYQSGKKSQYGYSEQQSFLPSQTSAPSQEPSLFETNLTNVRNLQSVPSPSPTPIPLNYRRPLTPELTSEATSSTTGTADLKIDIPRRRSYTKTIVTGGAEIVEVEVNGEIIVSPDGWRRHTRVFGGGVCKACEESERRLSA